VAALAARLGAAAVLVLAVAGCGGSHHSTASQASSTTTRTSTGTVPKSPIDVARPVPDATVTSPVKVSGTANVFEANVTVEILDATGKVVGKGNTTASCGTGCRGKYSVSVPFTVSKAQSGAVLVHDDDAAGTGSPPHSVQIPVALTP
jgi:immunoglobulin-like protein involved in spore germination